jgi:uncharacterized protein (TIGR02099 family)
MTDLPESPPRESDPTAVPAIRSWRWLRAVLWAVGALWVLMLLGWALLHALILPRIDDQRAWLEAKASKALATHVQIGALSVQGNWLVPWIEARDVRLRDAQDRVVLQLPRVVASVSPWSLLQGSVQQLLIDQPVLDVRRDAQGRLWVAGMQLKQDDDTSASDWFFSQPEFVIQGGQVQWRDEFRHGSLGPLLELQDVRVVVRNHWHWHDWQIDATPPADFGKRLSLRGQFTQTPLHRRGDWQDWSGQAFLDLPYVDLANLRQWVQMDKNVALDQGRGRLRVWADVHKGVPTGVWADAGLDAVKLRLGADLAPLGLQHINGMLGWQWQDGSHEFIGQNLRFDTDEGEHWPGGDWRVNVRSDNARSGVVQAERLDLEALAQVAQRLPLPESVRNDMAKLQPRGAVRQLRLTWALGDNAQDPPHFTAQGRVEKLHLAHDSQGDLHHLPGFANANIEFELSEREGKAHVAVSNGQVVLPLGLDDPRMPLGDAAVQLAWQRSGEQLTVKFTQGRVSNDDVAGEFSGQWQTGTGEHRLPGVLDLSANLTRGKVAQVHRYLPNTLPEKVRDFVRDAMQAGSLGKTSVRIKGDLAQLPFADAKQGEFRIATQVNQGRFAYVLPQPKAPSWPALADIQGDLVFEHNGVSFKGSTKLEGAPNVVWQKVEVQIADLAKMRVKASGQARGPLQEVMQLISKSALNDLMDRALDKAQGNGNAEYTLALDLPIDALDKSKVDGTVTFTGNDLQAIAGTPVLTKANGVLEFGEQGFNLRNLKGRMLGGDVQLQGGLRFNQRDGDSPMQLRIKGHLTADGLRQAKELGFVSRLALRANGRADYEAVLGLRRHQPELLITSDLKGMALNLPAPLNKATNAVLPLRVETQLTKESLAPKSKVLQDQLRVTLGRLLSVAYLRDLSKDVPTVLQGGVAVGQAVTSGLVTTSSGVMLHVQWPSVNMDAWNDVLSEWTGGATIARPVAARPAPATRQAPSNKAIGGIEATAANAMDYVPANVALVADEVRISNRLMNKVVAGGARVGDLWRFNVAANEFNGAIELRPPSGNNPAQLYARLSYLIVPPSLLTEVEETMTPQPTSIPALDVVVNELTLRNKKLGRLELDAVNRASAGSANREWVLNKLNLTMPEASFTSKGNWAADGPRQRRTQITFNLQIDDSGKLLERFGMPGVVRDGHGKIEGQLTWQGSPLAIDYPTLAGKFNVGVDKGQFLKTEPGVGRLLGIFNLQALPRRLALDFSDVFYEGFAFDFFRGDVRVDKGIAYTNNLQMKGVSAAALIEGQSDLAKETQNLKVVVVPEINAGNASLYMATINPLIGLTSYLAQLVLSKPLVKAGTTELKVDGTWSNPRITKVDS